MKLQPNHLHFHTPYKYKYPFQLNNFDYLVVQIVVAQTTFITTYTTYASELSINFSLINFDKPCAIKASRSISPKLKPPSFLRPSGACSVNDVFNPLAS